MAEEKLISGANLPRSAKSELKEVSGDLKHTLYSAWDPAMRAFNAAYPTIDYILASILQNGTAEAPPIVTSPARQATAAEVELGSGFADGFRPETHWDGSIAAVDDSQRANLTGATVMSHVSQPEASTGYVDLGIQAMAPPTEQDKYLEVMANDNAPMVSDMDDAAQRISNGQAEVAAAYEQRSMNPNDYRLAA